MKNSARSLNFLSQLLLGDSKNADSKNASDSAANAAAVKNISSASNLSSDDFGDLWNLANSHHVIMRTFPALRAMMEAQGSDKLGWIDRALAK